MDLLYFALLPLINALNFSQTLIIPLILSVAASIWMALSGRRVRIPVLWFDWALLLLVFFAIVSTGANIFRLNDKSINHLVALLASVVFFYLAVERFTHRLSTASLLHALWLGYIACTGFGVIEFALTNFQGINVGNMIPRPAVLDYEPTFLGLPLIRARSTFEESGHFAAYMSISIPFLTYYHWHLRPSNIGQLLFVCLTATAMLAAFSVSAFLFLPIAAFAVSIFRVIRTQSIRRSNIAIAGLIIVCLLAMASSEELFYNVFLRKFQGASFIDRSDKFIATIDLMSQSSWYHLIFGFGPGSYENLGIKPAISVYLNFYRDYGFLGLSTLIFAMIYVVTSASRIQDPMGTAILFGCILTVLYFAAVPNYFHPHYYIPFIFYKRAFVRQ